MLKTQIIQIQLTKNSTNNITKSVYFPLDITFLIKIIKNKRYDKCFFYPSKSCFKVEKKNTRLLNFFKSLLSFFSCKSTLY